MINYRFIITIIISLVGCCMPDFGCGWYFKERWFCNVSAYRKVLWDPRPWNPYASRKIHSAAVSENLWVIACNFPLSCSSFNFLCIFSLALLFSYCLFLLLFIDLSDLACYFFFFIIIILLFFYFLCISSHLFFSLFPSLSFFSIFLFLLPPFLFSSFLQLTLPFPSYSFHLPLPSLSFLLAFFSSPFLLFLTSLLI